MNAVVTPEHRQTAGRLRELMAEYQEVELLVKIGEYKRGSDKVADQAIDRIDRIREFLRQRTDERSDYAATLQQMTQLLA